MKKHYIILGLFCLLAIVACSDNCLLYTSDAADE